MDESVQSLLGPSKRVRDPRPYYLEVFEGMVKGQWFWRLKSGNHKIVAGGEEWYSRRGGALGAVKKLQRAKVLSPELHVFILTKGNVMKEIG